VGKLSLRQTVPVFERRKPRPRAVQCIPPPLIYLCVMGLRLQSDPFVVPDCRFYEVRSGSAKLASVVTIILFCTILCNRRFFRTDRGAGALPKPGISLDAGCRDGICRTFLPLVQYPVQAVAASRISDRRDTMRHPQLKDVFCRSSLRSTDMGVCVYETRHQVHARRIQFFTAFTELRPARLVYRYPGIPHGHYINDPIAFHHNIHRADRWRERTVYQSDTADNQLVPRTLSLGSF